MSTLRSSSASISARGALCLVIAVMASLSALTVVRPSAASAATTVSPSMAGVDPEGIETQPASQMVNSLKAIKATGATWVRLDLSWPTVEPLRGVFNWSATDPAFDEARGLGLNVLAVLDYQAGWASSPGEPAAYDQFAAAAAQHYGPIGVHDWEIWNEPNLSGNWGGPVSPSQYTVTLWDADNALKSVQSNAFVIAGALSPAVDSTNGSSLSPLTFLQGMYAAGAEGHFDALSVHPASVPDLPMTPDSWNTFYNLPNLHNEMVANGDGNKDIWLTEYGAPTGNGTVSTTPSTQAQMITQAFQAAAQWSWAGPLFSYWEDTGTDTSNWFDNTGILDFYGDPKPSYYAFVSVIGGPSTSGMTASSGGPLPGATTLLSDGQELTSGQDVTDPYDGWMLIMQTDGNLVSYDANGAAHWSTGTYGDPGAVVWMQTDGNLVVYRGSTPLWASGTQGNPGAILVERNDGSVAVQAQSGATLWQTGS